MFIVYYLACGSILDPSFESPERRFKKNQEPEPLGKKIRSRSRLKKKSGAGAGKKFAGSPALIIVVSLSNKDYCMLIE